MAVLDAHQERVVLTRAVQLAHELGMKVRARISLEPRYSSVPTLVDMAATFGLDDVSFRVHSFQTQRERTVGAEPPMEALAELVRERYQTSRSRQRFIERYGSRLGPMIWRMGRSGLLGPNVRRQADGSESSSEVVAEG
jgi:hypothetical protein